MVMLDIESSGSDYMEMLASKRLLKVNIFKTHLHLFLLFCCAVFLSGCLMESSKWYIGDFDIKTPKARERSFKRYAKEISDSIAASLHRRYGSMDETSSPDTFLASLEPIHPETPAANFHVIVAWNRMTGHLNIGINKLGAEETAEIREARDVIERLLTQHPDFEWTYSISHNTFAR